MAIDAPPALDPITTEFKHVNLTSSECVMYELISGMMSVWLNYSQRVLGAWREIWHLMTIGQRASLRIRCDQYQDMLTTTQSVGLWWCEGCVCVCACV